MIRLDLTLGTPAENLALDEALLDWAESQNESLEVLRLWEAETPLVVVGRSSRLELEVNLAACQAEGVPVLRRVSGGAAIVTGPGCMMYALVLCYRSRPELRQIDRAHTRVLEQMASAIRSAVPKVRHAGTSDLAIADARSIEGAWRKFSGNSMRAKRNHFLYHGTILYDFDLSLISRYLQLPPRQPDYRQARSHDTFVTNLSLSRDALRQAIFAAWRADATIPDWPRERTSELVRTRYSQGVWNGWPE